MRNEIGVKVKNMNKFLASIVFSAIMLSAITFSVLVLVGSANADHNPSPNPAQSKAQCDKAGGQFSEDKSTKTNTCVVTEEASTKTVPARHPSGKWTVDVTTPGSTDTYTVQGSTRTHTRTGGGDPVVTACYNSQGNPIGDFENNKHCRPA
jgi:hypothetical protein